MSSAEILSSMLSLNFGENLREISKAHFLGKNKKNIS